MTTLTHEPNDGCGMCVFFSERGRDRCEAVPERVERPESGRRVLLETNPAPDWCPLRAGPVVVCSPPMGPAVKVRLAPQWPSDSPWDITYAKPSGAPKEYAALGPSLYGEGKVTAAYRAARERFPGVALEVVGRPDLGEYIVEIRPREGE